MKTYKDLVLRAIEILTNCLTDRTSSDAKANEVAVGLLLELFDGPEQREVFEHEWQLSQPQELFRTGWEALTDKTFAINVAKGFFAPERPVITSDQLLLIVCEICEGYEHHRKGRNDDKLTSRKGLEVELADSVIRTMNFARYMGFDIPGAIFEKSAFNEKRPYLHGDTYKAEDAPALARADKAVPQDLPPVPYPPKPDTAQEGKRLRVLTNTQKMEIRNYYSPQLVDFGDGHYWSDEDRCWLICPELWEDVAS